MTPAEKKAQDDLDLNMRLMEIGKAPLAVVESYKTKPIEYIDPAPKPIVVQIPFIEYVERVKRIKLDEWQRNFCQRLEDAAVGRTNERVWAVIHAEGQLGKSIILVQAFSAWILGHDPLHRIALATYNVTRSQRHSKVVIGIMNLPVHKQIFPNPDSWVDEKTSKEKWSTNARLKLNDGQDSFNPVGLQSGLTGSGFDCFPPDTLVKSEIGDIPIQDLHRLANPPRVWSFNHRTGQPELSVIKATREVLANDLIEITTQSGRVIRCTPNHRFFSEGRYVAAEAIKQGSRLSRLWQQEGLLQRPMLGLCVGDQAGEGTKQSSVYLSDVQGQEGSVQRGMPKVCIQDQASNGRSAVSMVRDEVSSSPVCREQAHQERNGQHLLLSGLRKPLECEASQKSRSVLQDVRCNYSKRGNQSEVLFAPVLAEAPHHTQESNLSKMWNQLQAEIHAVDVLWPLMCEQGPLQTYDGQRELAIQARTQLQQMVSRNATDSNGKRQLSVRSLSHETEAPYSGATWDSSRAEQADRSSHQSQSGSQQSNQFGNAVREMPSHSSRLISDTVTLVRRIRGASVPVYDIQVEGNSNFFAEQILVHNCLLIDDPYADQKEAFSETNRQNLQEFWDFTVMSRMGTYTNVFGMFHRYHVEDLAGYLLDKGSFDYWRYATVCDGPYIHDETGQRFDDPLGRKEGEYISPERRPPSYYNEVKKNSRVWNSMFQGRPSSEEGEFFLVNKIAKLTPEETDIRRSECTTIVRAWDPAATEDGGDYSVGAEIGMSPDGRVTIFDGVREQVESAGRDALQLKTAKRDGFDTVITFPNDPGAAGNTAVYHVQQLLKGYTVVPRPTSGSKEDRARSFASAVNSGMVSFGADMDDEFFKEAKKELRNFPLSDHDDIVDACADGYNECFERVSTGLVVKGFLPSLHLVKWESFVDRFGNTIPKDWTVYIGVTLTPDAATPNSAIIVARASERSGLPDSLFIVAEYKEFSADYAALFAWIGETVAQTCSATKPVIWLNKESAGMKATIQQKLGFSVRVFDYDAMAGVTEMNWYLQPTEAPHPFMPRRMAPRIFGLVEKEQYAVAVDLGGLISLRQEAATWSFIDKNGIKQPSKVGAVLNGLRMVTHRFRTVSKQMSVEEQVEMLVPEAAKTAMATASTGMEKLGASINLDFQREIAKGIIDPGWEESEWE